MLDEQDQGTRIGVAVALGVVLLLVVGLLGWLTMRGGHKAPATALAQAMRAAPAAGVQAPTTNVALAVTEAFVDAPLAGTVAGTLYFAVGKAELPADAAAAMATIKQAATATPNKKLVLSGFHDASGDPAKNAELAKNRAKAVRAALQAEGITPERIALRKPESTTGDGSSQEARRVEVRLND
jgi:outer membrane protein OmpA-like peptidoglycan-associated protein